MSLVLIQETAKEVRRLAIAGSPLAVGDFRLKKLLPPLEQAGAKVPAFAQVAKGISDLVDGKEADSPALLLSLSTLLNAILYTQGQTGADGDFRELQLCATNCASTRTTARGLKPLIEALTTAGGGRFDVVKTAVGGGAFHDLRLIGPALRALDDNYPELADLVAEKVLPGYGPGLAPLLKQQLELKGKKSDARRLRVLHQIDPAGTVELCKTALDEGSVEVKGAAIYCLAKHEDCLPLVLEQAGAKNKQLRAAALEALAEHDRPEVTALFTELIGGKTLDFLAKPFRALRNRQVLNSLLNEGKRVFDLGLKGDEAALPRCSEILDCLQERTDSETEQFLLACFARCDELAGLKPSKASTLAGADLMERLAMLLYEIGSPRALEAVLAQRQLLPPVAFGPVLRSALRTWSADKVYEEFAPLLGQKKGVGKEKSEVLQRTLWAACSDNAASYCYLFNIEPDAPEAKALKQVVLDPRWLDAAIKAGQPLLVCCLARPEHPGVVPYLLKLLAPKSQIQASLALEALARCHYPQITDVFLEQVSKRTRNARYLDWELQMLFQSARFLPAADLPRLDAFAASLDPKYIDQFLEALGPLRPQAGARDLPPNS